MQRKKYGIARAPSRFEGENRQLDMSDDDRNLGPQPLGALLAAHGLKPADLVAASTEQLTHKMVARAVKGRRLTPRTMHKVQRALALATGEERDLTELFTYARA